jgi:hypothetical protein
MEIDAEFQSLIPPPSADELAQLEASLKADGCRDALVVWGDTLLDGHNRYRICTRLGIEYQTVQAESVKTRGDAVLWIIGNQLGRRNLEPMQKVTLVERKRAILQERAKARQRGGQGGVLLPVSLPEANKGEVRSQLAEEVGVSTKTYDRLKTVVDHGTPELKQAVIEKKVSATTGAEIAKLEPEQQREIVKKDNKTAILQAVEAAHLREKRKESKKREPKKKEGWKPPEGPMNGMAIASMAISRLSEISAEDCERDKAFNGVIEYIRFAWGKEKLRTCVDNLDHQTRTERKENDNAGTQVQVYQGLYKVCQQPEQQAAD